MLESLRTLINPHCEICGELRPFAGPRLRLCRACCADLPWIKHQCSCCGLPLGADAQHCGDCLKWQPAFQHSAIPWLYDFPVSTLITGFKHHQRFAQGRLLTQLMAIFLSEHYAHRPLPQALVAVPLHRQRWRQRGFNQAHEIAIALGRQLQRPVLDQLIVRTQDTPSQQSLGRGQRKRNLKQAFQLTEHTGFRSVAIIDDVVTTGATVDAIARELRRCGVADIHIWALARTPSPSSR